MKLTILAHWQWAWSVFFFMTEKILARLDWYREIKLGEAVLQQTFSPKQEGTDDPADRFLKSIVSTLDMPEVLYQVVVVSALPINVQDPFVVSRKLIEQIKSLEPDLVCEFIYVSPAKLRGMPGE